MFHPWTPTQENAVCNSFHTSPNSTCNYFWSSIYIQEILLGFGFLSAPTLTSFTMGIYNKFGCVLLPYCRLHVVV